VGKENEFETNQSNAQSANQYFTPILKFSSNSRNQMVVRRPVTRVQTRAVTNLKRKSDLAAMLR
jgi:hypothetical protein